MGMGFRDCGAAGCLVFSHSHDLDVSFSTCKAILPKCLFKFSLHFEFRVMGDLDS